MTARHTDGRKTEADRPRDRDLLEPSPSTGYDGTTALLDAPHAHAVEPVGETSDGDEDRPALIDQDATANEVTVSHV